ncbi:MAG: glycosyltransferase [Cyanobacteria bacterium CRU_2_1]|nr:glycosyltransferase [Cyanobacteria bacterium RU_5_0]NJR58206.1 glycosyltransferase [Cyanobacteria bacterium CRU_2_1]
MPIAKPRISVVIPTYNCDRYLAEAIDSVLCQTYPAYEVIVVDDGSTDRTQIILQEYGNRIRSVRQYNQGVAVARNHGMLLAQGEWIAFLDADDVFLPDKLEAQIAIAGTHPHLGIIHSGWQRVNVKGELLTIVEPWHQVPHLSLESWLRWKPVLPSAMLFRRDWLNKSGGFDPRFPPAEDTDLVLRLAAMGCDADWLRQVTVNYRQHENSAMHKGLPQARSLSAVIDHFFAQPHLPESIRLQENPIRYNTLVWIAWYLHYTHHLTEMVEYLKRSWQYSPYLPMETIVHWAESFTAFSQSWGSEFNADALVNSAEWQALMRWINVKTQNT